MAVIRSVVDKRGFPRFMIGNKKFLSLPQACHALYLDEDEKLSFSTSDIFARRHDFTVQKVFHFYTGYQYGNLLSGRIKQPTLDKVVSQLNAVSPELLKQRVNQVSQKAIRKWMPEHGFLYARAAFRLLQQKGVLSLNPVPNPKKQARKPPVIPHQRDIQRLFELGDPVVKMFIYLCAVCGLRTSEALALKHSDIYGSRIMVNKHLTHKGLSNGHKSGLWRDIEVSPEFFVLLDRLDPAAPFLIYNSHKKDHSGHVAMGSFRRSRLKPLYAQLSLPYSNHALRHFAAATWLGEGRSIVEVKELLGHKNITTTLRDYGHLLVKKGAVKCTIRLDPDQEHKL